MIIKITVICDGVRPNGRRCGADFIGEHDVLVMSYDQLQDELEFEGWLALPDGRHLCDRCVDNWYWLCELLTGVRS